MATAALDNRAVGKQTPPQAPRVIPSTPGKEREGRTSTAARKTLLNNPDYRPAAKRKLFDDSGVTGVNNFMKSLHIID